jgi:hypothetical protein
MLFTTWSFSVTCRTALVFRSMSTCILLIILSVLSFWSCNFLSNVFSLVSIFVFSWSIVSIRASKQL